MFALQAYDTIQETRIVMEYELDWKHDDPTCLYNDPDFQPVCLINDVYCPRILNIASNEHTVSTWILNSYF